MLRIENYKIIEDGKTKITPIRTLRGLGLLAIDGKQGCLGWLTGYISSFPALEILVLGAKEKDALGWKLFVRKPDLGRIFAEMELPRLNVVWLRGWKLDCGDLVALRAERLRWIALEDCKGMNGGWIKAVTGKWKGVVVVESDSRFKDGVDFRGWRARAKGN
jgi:hypothetical protein